MSNILNEYDVKGIEEHLNSLSKEGVMKITINLFKGYGELADKYNQLQNTLDEVKDRIQSDIEENEELYADTPFIIEHENMDLHDYLKILDKVGGSNE